ncbi:helix-turn-helix domain-containing protein [Saccharomonospora halophila]|uniref:helix-turn-helix domain-containing protein n=1 Tax=Saccharomonospora halophila TaxID=129922 RepID=UPI00037B7B27|nr:helix-turn-helix transcriptional regulator [Saccharomonospora halophila]
MAGFTGAFRSPNESLISLRVTRALSQQELAEELNRLATTKYNRHLTLTKKSVYRWESGETESPKHLYQRLLAEYFGVSITELGFRRPQHQSNRPLDPVGITLTPEVPGESPDVVEDQQRWLAVRTALGSTRRSLALVAESLYPDYRVPGLEHTGVITRPDWIPAVPVSLGTVTSTLDSDAALPLITGGETESAAARPLATPGQRFRRYHDAMRELATPRLFENRLCFRIIKLDCSARSTGMTFGHMGFFDSMDTNEALAHETALHHLARDEQDQVTITKPSWRNLTFRKLIADPFDLSRRPLMGAVGTLTIRGGESPSIVLHQRDGSRVAGGGGMIHLMPAGVFQPSSILPAAVAEDFSLWRNIERELAEELLGHDEYDGSGQPIAYSDLEFFARLDRAYEVGDIRVWFLGITLDALTLCGDILTVAVIEPDLYDALFSRAVSANSEGMVTARTLPFEGNTLRDLREQGHLSPGAAAALHLAWIHRDTLLPRKGPAQA